MKDNINKTVAQKEKSTNVSGSEKEPTIFDLKPKLEKFPVIVLSGSLQYSDKINNLTKKLSSHFVVLAPCHVDTTLLKPDDDVEKILTEIHFQKIDMSDAMVVVNQNDYIGNGTLLEIIYANTIGIPIHFMYEPKSFVIRSIFDNLGIDYRRTPICYLIPQS